jgi:hypothetical protein
MTAPRLKGLHHIKLPVTDLDASLPGISGCSTPNT